MNRFMTNLTEQYTVSLTNCNIMKKEVVIVNLYCKVMLHSARKNYRDELNVHFSAVGNF